MLRYHPGNKNRGESLIEILVTIAIIGLTMVTLLGLASLSWSTLVLMRQITLANNIAQETMEAVRNFRDGTFWNNDDPQDKYDGLGVLTAGISYHPEKSTDNPPRWMMISGEQTADGFTRKVIFENVMRDGNDNIVVGGGIDDPGTKKVTVTVSWQERERPHQVKLVTYLTNWKQ